MHPDDRGNRRVVLYTPDRMTLSKARETMLRFLSLLCLSFVEFVLLLEPRRKK